MHLASRYLRPLALGLAAAALCAWGGMAQAPSFKERLEACGSCHGADGNSRLQNVPSLAGQPVLFMVNQLIFMREGVRPVEVMAPFVKGLEDAEIEALARHYAGLESKPSDEPIDPSLAKRGAEIAAERRCSSCHSPSLAGQDQIPRIAGQRVDYLVLSLKRFRDNPHPAADTTMSVSVAGLSDADLAALAHYAASR
jgi:cytochrome c553